MLKRAGMAVAVLLLLTAAGLAQEDGHFDVSIGGAGVFVSAALRSRRSSIACLILGRQGAFFGLDCGVYPLDAAHSLSVPPTGQPWPARPRFATCGLVPWPDFLNCVTVYNREDWRAYLEAMVRMRFNTLGVPPPSPPAVVLASSPALLVPSFPWSLYLGRSGLVKNAFKMSVSSNSWCCSSCSRPARYA